MGEEIALSMRAWTAGWDIYAPRQNLIAHQYRPGRLGLPKFWEAVGRDSHRPNLNTRLQAHVIRRIKYMVGYPTDTAEEIQKGSDEIVLTEAEHYSMGTVRTREAYLELTGIDPVNEVCSKMDWCINGELE
jgi:Glycosyltransferase (GlcNAc)